MIYKYNREIPNTSFLPTFFKKSSLLNKNEHFSGVIDNQSLVNQVVRWDKNNLHYISGVQVNVYFRHCKSMI